ncbi:hypothetical protein ACEPPN_004008 [Leptodophora sp. 'Broadleaf-Isolate-01']
MATPAQQLQQLQLEVQALQQQVNVLSSRPQTQQRPKPSLPEPEKFSGNTTKWDTWLPSIEAKLLVDGEAIGNSTAQFYYVYLNLESQAQSLVLPQLAIAKSTETWDYQTILDQLARAYDSPTKPDHSKIISFRQGLNSTIRGRLSHQLSLPNTYSAYIATVQQLSARSTQHVNFQSSTPPTILQRPHTSYPRHNTDANTGDPMEVGQINSLEINHLGEISYVDPDTDRETYANVQARLDVVDGKSYATPRQQKRWKQQGNCMNCGDHYHWAKECPYGNPTTKKRRPMTRR